MPRLAHALEAEPFKGQGCRSTEHYRSFYPQVDVPVCTVEQQSCKLLLQCRIWQNAWYIQSITYALCAIIIEIGHT